MCVVACAGTLQVDHMGSVVGAVGQYEAAVLDGVSPAFRLLRRSDWDTRGSFCRLDLALAASESDE